MPWSKQQQRAIDTYNKNILVAAAAGSGKTSVLVERVIQRIVRKTCDINQILVVTFTNAAAAEMRERIAHAITEQLPPKDKERQLVLLNAASISTLHAFCQNIIRQYFHQLGLDPKFRLANPQEIDLLKLDVLENLFENNYDNVENEDFLAFTDTYGNEKGDDSTYDIILKLYEYSRSQPFPKQWLQELPQYFNVTNINELESTPWIKIIKDTVADELNVALSNSQKMYNLAQEEHNDYYLNLIASDIDNINDFINHAQNSWGDLAEAINNFKFPQMRPPKGTEPDLKEKFSKLRDETKKIIKNVKENYLVHSIEDTFEDLPKLFKQASTLCQVTLQFAEEFATAKQERAIVDFSDLEHFTLNLLVDNKSTLDNMIPTNIAKALQEKYVEIMVDEYQDTNGVQEAILKMIASPDKPNLFFVGDVKQSIYKFRLAEPELFLDKYQSYPTHEDCERIDLSQNFRSRKEILDGINFIFSQIMTPKAGELSYGKDEALYCGFEYPNADFPTLKSPIEINILDKQQKLSYANNLEDNLDDNPQGFAAEAKYIVQRLKELFNESPYVFDKNAKTYRPLRWKDIVILLRSVQDKAKILADALREANIPVYANIDSGYFQETEVRTMISLLQIIDNPQQDIPLTAILYSPIFNFDIENLANIRLKSPHGNMYNALQTINNDENSHSKLKEKIHNFLCKLNKWRDYARCHSVPELIWLLFNDTGYYDYVGGLPEGSVRQANLRALYDRARNYEQTSFRGLFRFLRFIHKMQHMGNDLSVARNLSENEDVVRIMSIHKSKGLEFPVVILADTGKQFNLRDTQENVLFHKKLGLGLYVNDIKNNIRYHNLSRQAIVQQIINEYKAEEMRVLYVAMTRAREKLIITGSVRDITRFSQNACSHSQVGEITLPDYFISQARSYLDWLAFSLIRHRDGLPLRQQANNESSVLLSDPSMWQISFIAELDLLDEDRSLTDNSELFHRISENKPLPDTIYKNTVKKILDWHYPYQDSLTIPTKLSVTEIKEKFASDLNVDASATNMFDDILYKRPQFLQEKTALTAIEYGSLMHTIMQHIDFSKASTDAGILEQLQILGDKDIIDKALIKKVYRKNIKDFVNSSIGLRIKNAKNIYRELAFNRMISASEYYENAHDDEMIFLQGVVDLLIEEDDGFILLDYKTDHCDVDAAKQKYEVQINLYTTAIEKIMHKPVKEKYLYLFHEASLIKM